MAIEIKDNELYKIQELSEKLGISKPTLRRKIREGKLKANKLGRELVVWGSDFREFIGKQGRTTHAGYGDRDLLALAHRRARENRQKKKR